MSDATSRGERIHHALHGYEAMARAVDRAGGNAEQQKRSALYVTFRLLRFSEAEARDAVERVMTDKGPIRRV